MNNDLEQFSEERLKDMQKHVTAGMTLGHADALLIRQAIGIAIAAKQAKPVGWLFMGDEISGKQFSFPDDIYDEQKAYCLPCYTTPPANSPAIPDGWKLVPIEMTDDIGEAIAKQARCCGGIALDIYDAMLSAAPKPESE